MALVNYILIHSIFLLVFQLYNPNEFKKDFYQNFEVKRGATLVLDHGNGRVELTSWEKDVVNVVVHYHSERQAVYSAPGTELFDVHFKQKDDLISISGIENMPKGIAVSSRRVYEYYYLIQAPAYLNLELHGRRGNVSIDSWTGSISSEVSDSQIEMKNIDSPSIDLKMKDGTIRIETIKGLLAIETEDSEITISDCQTSMGQIELASGILKIDHGSGNFNVGLENGQVELSKMTVNQLDINSAEADIDLELMRSEDLAINIHSEEGDIKVAMDKDNSAAIRIKTAEGDLDSGDFELKKENDLNIGMIGNGDGLIKLESDQGNIKIRLF